MKICPKCSHKQQNIVECEKCGLIFAKYEAFQKRKKEQAEADERAAAKKSGLSPIGIVLLVLALIGGSSAATYFFIQQKSQKTATITADMSTATNSAKENSKTSFSDIPANNFSTNTQAPPPRIKNTKLSGNTGNAIELARKATVTIKTPWGTGSGFFVDKNYIVTNRHVIELDPKQLAEMRKQIDRLGELIRLEKQKLAKIQKDMNRYDAYSKKQARIVIKQIKEELAKVTPRYTEELNRLKEMEKGISQSDITIVFDDGSEQSANYLLPSSNYDLALMTVFTGERPAIPRAPEGRPLQQGDKVYTIGSPAGLQQTVTAGIFSGYRQNEENGKVYLQTDAAINPGNSGGPLIDEKGRAVGVNTMIYRNTEGIGFAIPIDTVFEEFNSSLY